MMKRIILSLAIMLLISSLSFAITPEEILNKVQAQKELLEDMKAVVTANIAIQIIYW